MRLVGSTFENKPHLPDVLISRAVGTACHAKSISKLSDRLHRIPSLPVFQAGQWSGATDRSHRHLQYVAEPVFE